ncbi:MAG: aspartyl/glutamyl-tRNA amidotransferase subunit C [Spirochaetales bacterium]|nr:aspartyl/glutamyl-tRNA amidotransferase subunit C [Spirochaetales bacterium]
MDVSELKITAELANLDLTGEDLASLGNEVEKILDYFSSMMEADTAGLAAGKAGSAANRLRPDVRTPGDADALLENAPELEGRFIVIPNVL